MQKLLVLAVLITAIVMVGCSSAPLYISTLPFSKVGEVNVREGGVIRAAQNGGIQSVALVDIRDTVFKRYYVVAGE